MNTDSALVARLRRRLRHRGELLRTCRYGSRWFHQMGRHYIVDAGTNGVMHTHVDPADWLATLDEEVAAALQVEAHAATLAAVAAELQALADGQADQICWLAAEEIQSIGGKDCESFRAGG